MTVPDKLRSLSKKAAQLGCVLEIKESYPFYVVAVIPDHPSSKDMLHNTQLCDGVFIYVRPTDMDKKAKHSRYYKQLTDLETRLESVQLRLVERVLSLKGQRCI